MSEQLVATAANASRLVDSAEGILEARTAPKAVTPSERNAVGNDSSSHNLKLFWDGQRMAQTIPSLNQQIAESAMENNRELDRMAAEVSEQEMLAVDMRHRMEPLLQSVDKVHAGGREAARRRREARKLQQRAGMTPKGGRHPLLKFGDQIFSQIMQTRGCTEGLLQLHRMRDLLDSVIAEVKQINDARGATDVKKLTSVRSSFILLSKEMTLSGGGPTFTRPNKDADAMARERLSVSQPMPRASEQARVSAVIDVDDGLKDAIYPPGNESSSRRESGGVTPLPGFHGRPESAASTKVSTSAISEAAVPEPRTQSEIEAQARVALRKAASEREMYEGMIGKMKSQIRQLEENGMALSTELHDTGAAYTEASKSNDDLLAEAKQLRRQLKNSMALVDNLQAELQRATDTEAQKYAGDKADRTAAYFELESTLHKTRAEKTKLVRENKQLQRKVEKFESANSGAAAQGMLTDGGWDLAVERGKRLSAAESTIVNIQSRCRMLEHKLLRMTAARDAASAAERVIASAEDEVRQCLAEADEPYPFPDIDAGAQNAPQDRSSMSSKTASVSDATTTEEDVGELQKKVDALSEDAASKEALVAKLQSQLDQLVQQLAEKREAIHDVDAAAQASNAPAPAQAHLVERGGKLDEPVVSE